jgi:hypothetical protein
MTELTDKQTETIDANEYTIRYCIEDILGINEDTLLNADDSSDLIHTIYDQIATWGETILGIPEMETYPYIDEEEAEDEQKRTVVKSLLGIEPCPDCIHYALGQCCLGWTAGIDCPDYYQRKPK